MKFPTFTYLWQPFSMVILWSCLLIACQSTPSADDYAERLCTCYGAASEPALQLRAGEIDRPAYDQLVIECMGEDDPLKALEEDPEALLQFKASFLDALHSTCPEVARSLGY